MPDPIAIRDQVLSRVLSVVRPNTFDTARVVGLDTQLSELGLDSLAMLELAHMLEADFKITLNDRFLATASTVGDFVQAIADEAKKSSVGQTCAEPLSFDRTLFAVTAHKADADLSNFLSAVDQLAPVFGVRTEQVSEMAPVIDFLQARSDTMYGLCLPSSWQDDPIWLCTQRPGLNLGLTSVFASQTQIYAQRVAILRPVLCFSEKEAVKMLSTWPDSRRSLSVKPFPRKDAS